MHHKSSIVARIGIAVISLVASYATTPLAYADHTWNNYHWERNTPTHSIFVGNNVNRAWAPYFSTAVAAWSESKVLDLIPDEGMTSPTTCAPLTGRVEVCNARYGNTGWLGIATLWVSGDHIIAGTVKLNDTYFSTRTFNTKAWRNLVMCQELAHTFGLGHQDENFQNANLGTCTDYTNIPNTNQFPNAHDFDMISYLYGHIDVPFGGADATAAFGQYIDTGSPIEWGAPNQKHRHKGRGKRESEFERPLPNGVTMLTHVMWADEMLVGSEPEQKPTRKNKKQPVVEEHTDHDHSHTSEVTFG